MQQNRLKHGSIGSVPRLALMALTCCLLASSVSEAVLFITPTRLVFEGRQRAATVTFLNQKDTPKTYRLFWRDKKQGPDGKFVDMLEGDDVPWSAKSLIRYSPRQVTVEPQESQVVRFALRKPKDLPEGEYRSHLVIEEQEPPKGEDDLGGDAIGVKINMLYSYTMPILVVHGKQKVDVKVRDFDTYRSEGREWIAEALFENSGGTSALGILRLEWEGPEGTEVLAEGGSVNIYLPQRRRKISLKYQRPNTPGRLRMAYYEDRHAERLTTALPSTELITEAYLK